ncbi:hypothetical protein BJY01DRAFT_206972 [Aspergillus pseudoustus]|uniref:Uncharacterized protein n=1 Tax=Aspergillus pseudoustus TaxID=1810923 RepID=A0ABR4KM86_9EURO
MSATSVLGESWVVPSIQPRNEDVASKDSPETPKQHPRPLREGGNHGLESSTSSISGPELVMPSIYETPISEESWVAPNIRPRDSKQTGPNLRRRPQPSAEPIKAKNTPVVPNKSAHSTTTPKDQTRLRFPETPLQTIINILLLAAIAHLLVLPELVQQYQGLCTIGPIATLYPSSCVASFRQPSSPRHNHQSTPITAITLFQTRLESLFNTTLYEIVPLNGALKQTESQLRTVERELKRAHPGTKHELDLEFESCWRAIRTAGWKFDSLKVDLQSAIDSLVAVGDVKLTGHQSSIAEGARLSTQMIRREQYIEQLTARMRSKADSLAADLATLDDHLESIESIVDRETTQPHMPPAYQPKGSSNRLLAFVNAIVPPSVALPSFVRPSNRDFVEGTNDATSSSEPTLSQIFREAAAHHRPVADAARSLSKQLQRFLQNKKGTHY